MKVKILVAGKYNGKDLRSVDCKVGDELDTKEWYARKLIELKDARALTKDEAAKAEKAETAANPEAAAEKVEAKAKKKAPDSPSGARSARVEPVDKTNVFLG